MVRETQVECSFLIPVVRDTNLLDGQPHPTEAWDWLDVELYTLFGGRTLAPGLYEGFYRDPHTQAKVSDQSRKYIVVVPSRAVDQLRLLLAEACWGFRQKCIYLSIAGEVEFIEANDHEPDEDLR
jgi:hypothetical protein